MKRITKSNRRQFLTTAAGASAAAFAAPMFIPSHVLGKDGAVAPSNKIVMGSIGVGGQGRGNLGAFLGQADTQVVAVCDVDSRHRGLARDMANKKYGNKDCATLADFRELTNRKDIDAVVVCTPDHWHALATIAAARSGKDVYCEKPLANSIGEGRAVVEALREKGRILQTGSHERSGNNARYVAELVLNGYLGKLHTIRINLPTDEWQHKAVKAFKDNPPAQPIPEGFDYDAWLGHTPVAPYHEKRCHFWWRFILNYGSGEMSDRGAHVIDLAHLCAGLDDTGPVDIKATGTASKTSLYDAFMEYEFECVYPNGIRMVGASSGTRGLKLEGDKGWIFIHVHGQKLEASSPDLLKIKLGPNDVRVERSPGHHRNFLDCIKSRKQPVASAEIGHRTATACHLNIIAMKLGRPLKWDPKAETFGDDKEANALITPKMRAPWSLGVKPG